MNPSTEAVTSSLMKLALDGAALRHQAIAANIANATKPGYTPLRVAFESRLQEARDRLQAGEAPRNVASELAPAIEADTEATTAVDLQAAQLAQNVVHYQALLKATAKRMSILAMAINEGKR